MGQLLTALWAQATRPEIEYFNLKDPNPEPSFVMFILNAFFFIAVVLLVTFAIGVAFGGFRFWLLGKYPNNPLNGADKEDIAETFRLSDDPSANPDGGA